MHSHHPSSSPGPRGLITSRAPRNVAFAILFGASLLSGSAQAQFADPEALVRAVYATYSRPGAPGLPADQPGLSRYMEPDLAKAWSLNARRIDAGDLNDVVDWDPFVNGQDDKLTNLEVVRVSPKGARADVSVRFRNFGSLQRITYEVIRSADGWRIFDVRSTPGGSLRQLLKIRVGAKAPP